MSCHNVESKMKNYQLRCALAMLTFWMGSLVMINSSYQNPVSNKKDPKTSELTEGGADASLHFSITKGLGSSAPKPWELLGAPGASRHPGHWSKMCMWIIINLSKYIKTILYINQSPTRRISWSIFIYQV